MQLTLSTLGTLQASTTDAQGNVRSLSRGKPVAMLAYLACIPGHKASREHLAALLWGDVDSDAARQNLRQTIWYLKQKLGDGVLDVAGDILGLAASVTSDRDEFLRGAQSTDFSAAVGRYAGPFIPDFAAPGASEFEQWCELERRRLTVTFLRCADALARQWLSEGHFRDAQDLARRARDVDPMDQATWRLLLEALVAGSDGLRATSEAEHFEAFLEQEGQELEAASIAVLRTARRSPSLRSPGDSGPSASIAAELVGREAEFSCVLSAWEQARNGTPRVLVITAAAGLGKSRLLRDVQARLRASRSRALLVRANPGDRHLSGGFAAEVASQLAALPGAAAVSTSSAGVLVTLAPALASIYSSAVPDRSDGEEAVRRRALALVDLARAVAEEHPVALLLDDLHWADAHSTRVLSAAFSRLEHARLLVVCTKRPAGDVRALFSSFDHLDLPPLDLPAVSAFVAQVAELPSTPWAEVLPQQLLLATGGSPLLLVETLHGALEQGWLSVSDAGAWQCDDPARITASLREGSAVQQRVQRLAPDARRLLLVLAVVGRPVEAADAIAMAGGDATGLDEHTETLERGGFLVRSGSQLVVAHDEIADAVMQGAVEADRGLVHAGVARELLARSGDEMPLRHAAEHASAAGDVVMLRRAWRRFLTLRRQQGDRRGTRRVAADFLGPAADPDAVRELVAATPWRKRQRARWLAAASLLLVVGAGIASAWSNRPDEPTSVFAFWEVDSATGRGRLVGARIPSSAAWEAGIAIELVALDSTDFPVVEGRKYDALYRSPSGKEWWVAVVDSVLGDESVFVDSLGDRHAPVASPADDAITDLSPDGRLFTGISARYDTVTDHSSIIVGNPRGGSLRRVSHTLDGDRAPAWRPDGTQIAFQRRFFTTRSADRICLVDVDGTNERCLESELTDAETFRGWLDERRVLISSADSVALALDVVTGERTRVDNLRGRVHTSAGLLRLCMCSVAPGAPPSWYLFPAANPSATRPLRVDGQVARGHPRIIASVAAQGQWLETLRLVRPANGIVLGYTHHLRVDGYRANGASAWLHDLRWTSRDPSVATVDSLGHLRPRREGVTWVVVSAGGWRTDSAQVRIVPTSTQTVVGERWDSGWEHRWRVFGNPVGTVVTTNRGPAFLPNGDGSYASGGYLPVTIPTSQGMGLEADVSLLVTGTQWQTLSIELQDAELLSSLGNWDHRTGDGVTGGNRVCSLSFPGTEGASFRDAYSLAGRGGFLNLPSTPTLFDGSWHRIRLQLLPDGRCALALDGRPIGDVPTQMPQWDGVFVVLSGSARLGGRLVVGPMEAWQGVRRGVNWSLLDPP